MKEAVALAKEADTKKDFSPTRSDKSVHRVRNGPERQLGSLGGVIGNIRRDGGTPSVESIATELSGMHTAERGPVLLALQRTHGNQYVQRVVMGIQAKLKVGQPGDIYEQEAERVAEQVMGMTEPQVKWQVKKEKEELLSSEWIERQIAEAKSSGQPLENNTRQFMESAFGHDFSDVRIHTSLKAAKSAKALGAEAYTSGNDIFFGLHRYQPSSKEGTKLIAHELTHVVQQRGSRGSFQEKITIGQPGDVYEREADKMATIVMQMEPLRPILHDKNISSILVSRKTGYHRVGDSLIVQRDLEGALIGGAIGVAGGAAAGALLGSVVPGIGTAAGAIGGAIIGGILGGIIGAVGVGGQSTCCDRHSIGRNPTPSESRDAKSKYPRLVDGQWCVTGPATGAYNCIAWSLGLTSPWIWDQVDHAGDNDTHVSVADFDSFYASHGYVPSTSPANIALFGTGGDPTHAARRSTYRCNGNVMYESKRGTNIRIAHILSQLEGGFYGNVIKHYRRS